MTFKSTVEQLPAPTGPYQSPYRTTHTVSWSSPRSADIEVRVYGVTTCLGEPADPPPGSHGPCLVEGTALPRSVMALARTASAAAGEISWVAPFAYECAGPPVGPDALDYDSIVIAAYNAAGHSIFAIAYPGEWWRAAPGASIHATSGPMSARTTSWFAARPAA